MSTPIRVVIADDHAIVREGLRILLAGIADVEVVADAASGPEAVTAVETHRPDVVLLDVRMPGNEALQAVRTILERQPASRVLLLTSYIEERLIDDAIKAGVAGYLLKDTTRDDLVAAIRDAHVGRSVLHPEVQETLLRRIRAPHAPAPTEALTARELQVLRHIAAGQSNKQIAAALYLSEGTVKGYTSAIFGKLGVADRTQAALYALRAGVTPAEEPDHRS